MNPIFVRSLFLFTILLAQTTSASPLVKVNQNPITLEDLNAHIEISKLQGKVFSTHQEALEDLVANTALVEVAKKSGLEKNATLRQELQLVWIRNYVNQNLQPKGVPSESDLKSWYSKNPEIRISQIFVGMPVNPTAEDEKTAKEKCLKVRKEIESDKLTFAMAALQHSEAPSRAQGGDLGYRNFLTLEPQVYDAALQLKNPGDVSEPIRGSMGYHLIRLTGKKTFLEMGEKQVAGLYGYFQQNELLKKAKKDAKSQVKIEWPKGTE